MVSGWNSSTRTAPEPSTTGKAVGIGGLHVEAIAARGRAFGDGPAQLGKAVGPDDELPPQDRPFRGIGQFREEGHVGRQRFQSPRA